MDLFKTPFTKCQDVDILYSPLPQWFRKNPKLLDELGCALPEDQEPKWPCLRCIAENDMDMTLGEAFAIMDMDVDGEQGMESPTVAQADGQVEAKGQAEEEGQLDRADLVFIRANIGAIEVHMAGATLEELYNQHDEEVVGYKARISFLESRIVALTVRDDNSSSSGSIVPRDEYLQSLQVEKGAIVEEARNAKLHAMQISTANQEIQVTVEVLQGKVDKLCYKL